MGKMPMYVYVCTRGPPGMWPYFAGEWKFDRSRPASLYLVCKRRYITTGAESAGWELGLEDSEGVICLV